MGRMSVVCVGKPLLCSVYVSVLNPRGSKIVSAPLSSYSVDDSLRDIYRKICFSTSISDIAVADETIFIPVDHVKSIPSPIRWQSTADKNYWRSAALYTNRCSMYTTHWNVQKKKIKKLPTTWSRNDRDFRRAHVSGCHRVQNSWPSIRVPRIYGRVSYSRRRQARYTVRTLQEQPDSAVACA